MARNEVTSERVGKIAARGAKTGKLSEKDTKAVSASALTQRPPKKKAKKARRR